MKSLASVLFALFLITLFSGVKEADALNFGRVSVNPYVEFNTFYDDNVFRVNSGKIDDWYFLVSPGIKLTVPQRENLIELEYKADIYKYVSTGDANDVVDHFLRGAAAFNFPGGLSIKAEDIAKRSHESRGEANTAITGTGLNRYYSNLLNTEAGYTFADRYKIAVGYQYFYIDYNLPSSKFRDQLDNGATLTLFYQLMPKTSALVEGSYKHIDHNDPNGSITNPSTLNSNEYWARGGLTWDITAKSTGTIKGGYEWKLFESPGRKDFRSPVFEVTLDHRFTSKTGIKLSGLRQAYESDDQQSSFYTTTMGRLGLDYMPLPKITITPSTSYADNRYSQNITIGAQTGRRKDGLWDAGLDVTYIMNKWVAMSVGYTHTKRVSNFTVYDYTDNLAMVRIKGTI